MDGDIRRALFAAFPVAYATVFSRFHIAFFLRLACLRGRAVSLAIRSKVYSDAWRKMWDVGFSLSSFIAAFLLGIACGNFMASMELAPKYHYQGSLSSQLYL